MCGHETDGAGVPGITETHEPLPCPQHCGEEFGWQEDVDTHMRIRHPSGGSTHAQQSAWRDYMHDLNRRAAVALGLDAQTFNSTTCAACGGDIAQEPAGDIHLPVDAAEVINRTTGARGLAHTECYLSDTCCYSLA